MDRAIADYDQAIRLSPKDVGAYVGRGTAYATKGETDRAIADYDQAIRLDPNIVATYGQRGFVYFNMGAYDRAIADANEAIRLDPNEASHYIARGAAFEKRGDTAQARADYEKALELSPGDSVATARLARLAKEARPPAPAPIAALGVRVALVIGNARYEAQSRLKNPHNDATAVAGALRAAGFKTVTIAENLSREALVKALQKFQDEADSADWAVIYFSGHGIEVNGVNFVVPTDARLKTDRNIADEAVSLNRLMESVGGAKKLKVVILDACRENPLAHAMQRTLAFKSADKGLAPVEPDLATLVVYAARDGQLAQDGDGDNSPFAAALAKHLSEPHVEVSKLFRLVTDDVLDATKHRQQPFVYGSLPGREDFYFRP